MWMLYKKEFLVNSRLKKKLLSTLIVAVMLLTSLTVMVQISKAEPNDIIKTYDSSDLDTETNTFDNGSFVVVNISVDNKVGDPQPYMLRAVANSSEEIWFYVLDNDTNPPWGSRNNLDDGVYWGGV